MLAHHSELYFRRCILILGIQSIWWSVSCLPLGSGGIIIALDRKHISFLGLCFPYVYLASGGLLKVFDLVSKLQNSNLCLHHHMAFSVSLCLLGCLPRRIPVIGTKGHPTPVWAHLNMTSVTTLFPNEVILWGPTVSNGAYFCGGRRSNSTHNSELECSLL